MAMTRTEVAELSDTALWLLITRAASPSGRSGGRFQRQLSRFNSSSAQDHHLDNSPSVEDYMVRLSSSRRNATSSADAADGVVFALVRERVAWIAAACAI